MVRWGLVYLLFIFEVENSEHTAAGQHCPWSGVGLQFRGLGVTVLVAGPSVSSAQLLSGCRWWPGAVSRAHG